MTVLATDDFNRADNLDLGVAWTPNVDTFKIVGNVAKAINPGTSDAAERNNSVSFPNNQWAEATLGTVTGGGGLGSGYGPAVRMGATDTLYRVVGNSAGFELSRFVAGAFTSIASGAGTTFATGDVLYLEWQGAIPVMKKNGASFGSPPSDSAIAGGAAGVAESAVVDAADGINSWQAGDFAAATVDGGFSGTRAHPALIGPGRIAWLTRDEKPAIPTDQPAPIMPETIAKAAPADLPAVSGPGRFEWITRDKHVALPDVFVAPIMPEAVAIPAPIRPGTGPFAKAWLTRDKHPAIPDQQPAPIMPEAVAIPAQIRPGVGPFLQAWLRRDQHPAITVGVSGFIGTLVIGERADTLAASGLVTILGTLAKTEGADTLAASGLVTVLGTLAESERADTLAASGLVTVLGTLAKSEAHDSMAAAGVVTVIGTLARTEIHDTMAASGLLGAYGTAADVEGRDSSVASGSVTSPLVGTMAVTEGADTMQASDALADTRAPNYYGGGKKRYGVFHQDRSEHLPSARRAQDDDLVERVTKHWELIELRKKQAAERKKAGEIPKPDEEAAHEVVAKAPTPKSDTGESHTSSHIPKRVVRSPVLKIDQDAVLARKVLDDAQSAVDRDKTLLNVVEEAEEMELMMLMAVAAAEDDD